MKRSRVTRLTADLALISVAFLESVSTVEWGTPAECALAIGAAAGLTLRKRLPWPSLLSAIPAFTLNLATLAGLIALFSVAIAETRRWRLTLAGVFVFGLAIHPWWGSLAPNHVVLAAVYAALYAGAPIALGLLMRTREELSARLRDLQEIREHERARIESDILSAERAHIAREMHDVVSHQVSLIAVQAGAAQMQTHEDGTRQIAMTIRLQATQTLDELRDMVALLREGPEHGPASPQPSVRDLANLIRESGIDVRASIDLPDDLPAGLQRAIFRTIQESLTNARKHAPGESVHLAAHAQQVELKIRNGLPVVFGPREHEPPGHGLVGLRERADLLNGTLEVCKDGSSFTLLFRAPY